MGKYSFDDFRKVRLFQDLTDKQIELVSLLLEPLHITKGQYIIKEQTLGDHIFILMDGTVRVTKELVKGVDDQETGEKTLATITSALFPTFGETGLLGESLRSANVIAVSDCQLYTLSQKDFDHFTKDNPEIALKIMRNIASVLSDRLIDTDENLVKLATALYISVSR
ncbi:MAG: cyclic nucleotide-binding domain-containing protein [Candidatus Cloacimonetes bacterium]|nr:cyclic nucleotide-binding domain-containing protein [Candidatus Cloacimonadota bacterium]